MHYKLSSLLSGTVIEVVGAKFAEGKWEKIGEKLTKEQSSNCDFQIFCRLSSSFRNRGIKELV